MKSQFPLRSLHGGLLAASVFLAGNPVNPSGTLLAQEKVFEITQFRARLEVQTDGAYHIREEITFDFQQGSFTFAVRDIPLSNSDGVSSVNVRSADVTISLVEQEEEGDSWRVRWEFPPTSGQATFVLEYDLFGALREVEGANEVLWRVVGSGWEVPFQNVSAEIAIPSGLPVSLSDLTLDPPDISSAQADGNALVARFLVGALPAGRAYQVKVSFPKVMEGRAVGLARTEAQATLVGFSAFALLLILWGLIAYRRLGPKLPVRRQTQPGTDLPTAAVLLHREAPSWDRVFPGTLFDLANRGFISLERVDRKKGLFTSQKVILHRNAEARGELSPFEVTLLGELEACEDLEEFSTKGKKFRKAAMREVREILVRTGHLADDRSRANRILLLGLAIGLLAVVTFILGAALGLPWVMASSGAGMGMALGMAIVGSVRFPRTRQGAECLAEIQGYLEGLRMELQQKMKMSPISAAEFLFSALPWLTLDPKYAGAEGHKLAKRLKKETGELRAPPWALDRTRAFEKAAAKHSAAYAAFLPVTNIAGATSGAVAPAAGGGVGGAAGGGAAGGGGGGAG